MTHRIWLALVLAAAAVTAGCNTMEGAGKDIERGGKRSSRRPNRATDIPASGPARR